MAEYQYDNIIPECLNVIKSCCSIPLVIICDILSHSTLSYIEDRDLMCLLRQYETNIYRYLYNWLKNDDLSLKDLLHQLLICCDNNNDIIIRILKEIQKNVCIFGRIEHLIHNMFHTGEYTTRLPSEFGLYKIKFINGYYLMDVEGRLNILFLNNESITQQLAAFSLSPPPSILEQNFQFPQNLIFTTKNIKVKQALKKIELEEIFDHVTELNLLNIPRNLKNIFEFIVSWKLTKDINATMNEFHKLMQGNVVMMNKLQQGNTHIDKLANPLKSFISQLSIHSLIEAKLLFSYGLKQQASQRILNFLYNSFKTKDDSFICLCLAYSVFFVSQIKPLDHGFDLLLRDLIEKSQNCFQYECLTYSKFITSLFKTDSNLWEIINDMIAIGVSDHSNLLCGTIYRAFFWNLMGFKNVSCNIFKTMKTSFFQFSYFINKFPKLYHSYISLYAFSLFQNGNADESIRMLNQFIHSSNGVKDKKIAIACLCKIQLETSKLPNHDLDRCYYRIDENLTRCLKALKVGDYVTAINKLSSEIDCADFRNDTWESSYNYIRRMSVLAEAYYLNDQQRECIKVSLVCYSYALLKNLYPYVAQSLIYICDSLLQLGCIEKILPFLQMLIGRYYCFLPSSLNTRVKSILYHFQNAAISDDISIFFKKLHPGLKEKQLGIYPNISNQVNAII